MKDFLGKPLKIGDEVVFMQIKYRSLVKGMIVAMSDKKATLYHMEDNLGRVKSIQFYNQMVKIW